jgi:hypothetical protein
MSLNIITIISLFTGRSNNSARGEYAGGGLVGFYGREGEPYRPAKRLGGFTGVRESFIGL